MTNMERYRFSQQEQRLMEALQVPFAIYQLVDKSVVTIVVSDGFCEMVGSKDRQKVYAAMDHDTYRNVHPEDVARLGNIIYRFMRDGGRFETIYRLKKQNESGYHVIHAYGRHMRTETGVLLAQIWYADEGTCSVESSDSKMQLNASLRSALQEESALQASYYDYLTGLPSMTYFFELAEASQQTIRQEGGQPVLLYMDFSGMKHYNTRHGFAEGDKLLQSFSRVLIPLFGVQRCSRIGADHFAVQTEEADLEEKIQKIFDACEKINNGKTLPLHIGVYRRESGSEHTSVACDRAKLACNALRGQYGMAVNYYSQSLKDEEDKKLYIIENIDRAIEEGWIHVYSQPIIRVANDKVSDEEALSRWIDPVRGFLSPADFIPTLEDAKLIYKLDLYVVEKILEKIKKMEAIGMFMIPQSVNLSRADFDSCDIVEEIRRRVDDAGIDRSMLTIEITESVIGSDFDFMKEQVERFQKLGFQVWMDDFGSGYSSLDVLQNIRFDLIKLDMHFMQQFDDNEEDRIILTELVKMTIGLGVDTVCEGVEKPEQVAFLQEIGCTKAQGYIYSEPVPFEAIFEMYESGKDIRVENPEETEYYSTLGRINLYDMNSIDSGSDDSLRRSFNTVPMAILEVNGNKIQYTRCNQSYRDFLKRFYEVDMTDQILDASSIPDDIGEGFMAAVLRCSQDGNPAMVDELVDSRTTIHSLLQRVAVNPVTGTVAIAIAVLAIMEEKSDSNVRFSDITKALSSDYINLYYVDAETDRFIEYTPEAGGTGIAVERRGSDFFQASAKDAELFIYKEDREYFIQSFRKENVLRMMDEHGTFTLTYRLMMDGKPVYVNMKAVRMSANKDHIIVGVSNVDAQVRQKEEMARLKEEQTTYSRINALTKGFICIYTVDPETGKYLEYSATSDYSGLNVPKKGDDFWAQAQKESSRLIYPDDLEKFQTHLQRDRVLQEIEERGIFTLQYRMFFGDEGPKYLALQAALVEEKDGPQLIIGVNNVDELVRREQDYERKLAAARSRANLDTLTGVKNRTAYDNMSQTLAQQIECGRSVRYAIALCRVRDLEQVNETQGHEEGDQMIRAACAIICETFKHSPVFRVAGDQFAAIAQGHDYECVDELITRLEEEGRRNSVAVACGMAKYEGTGSVASVFERADTLCRDQA